MFKLNFTTMLIMWIWIIFTFCSQCKAQGSHYKCAPRKYGFDSAVCVCNLTYCDNLPPCKRLKTGFINIYETSRDGSRFESTIKLFETVNYSSNDNDDDVFVIKVNSSRHFQGIIGFGGAFTDAAGINIASLPKKMQSDIISSYFSSHGSEYNLGRVPIASTDFSTRTYTYDDSEDDFYLQKFKLAAEDYKYKIPYIHQAMSMADEPLYLIGSPWSAPYWMKTNNSTIGKGTLIQKNKYFETWAHYFVRFLDSYNRNGIKIWGLTVQNEPFDGFVPMFPFQSMGYTAEMERDFIRDYLGPVLTKAGYGLPHVQLIICDDQRTFFPQFPDVVLSDSVSDSFVSGIGVHWYLNSIASPEVLDTTKERHPDKFILATEACRGGGETNAVELGNWERGESYAQDIIQDLLHSTSGWIDWNLALNEDGGPNFANNTVDSPIIVNATGEEFYKQPMFYVLAHFSKLTPRNSVRIETLVSDDDRQVDVIGFERSDRGIVVHVLNRETFSISIRITSDDGSYALLEIPPKALHSYVWWPEMGLLYPRQY